ncbi:TPA: DUF1643 domain-containing protein [Neisseria meningitidis]
MTYEKLYELRQTLRPTTKDGLYTDNEKSREILTVRWSGNTDYSTQQTGIRANTQTDFSKFKGCLEDADMIILAWGTDRSAYKDEKNRILEFLKAEKFMEKVFCISETGNSSDTRHPSRISYSYQLVQFEESA